MGMRQAWENFKAWCGKREPKEPYSEHGWRWTEDRPGMVCKNSLIDQNGNDVLKAVVGLSKWDAGVMVRPDALFLFPAAPRLLAAAKRFVELNEKNNSAFESILPEWYAELRAAIAAAEGDGASANRVSRVFNLG